MLTGNLWMNVLGAFGTGFLTSLSPCVYPMMPITLGFLSKQAARAEGRSSARWSVVFFAFGQAIALTLLGMLAVTLGETLGFSSQSRSVRVGVGLLLLAAAYFSFRGRLPQWMQKWNVLPQRLNDGGGLLAAFALGASAALVASPCTSPVLGAVLTVLATEKNQAIGFLLMLAYASGFSAVFLIAGLGMLRLGSLPRSGPWLNVAHKLGCAALLAAGIFYLVS